MNNFKSEEVHDFRVQMKKLRAFTRLWNAALPLEQQVEITGRMKSFYDVTGRIRNIQLHEKRVVDFCRDVSLDAPSSYLQDLKKEEKRQQEKATKAAKKTSFRKFKEKIEKLVTENYKADPAKNFTLQKESRLFMLFVLPWYSDETLHEIRKIFKDLLYNRIYTRPYLETVYFQGPAAMEPLTEKLGDFQDWFVSVQLLDEIDFSFKKEEAEKDRLLFIKNEFENRKMNLKQQILQLLQKISHEQEIRESQLFLPLALHRNPV